MKVRSFFDQNGNPVALGPQLGQPGGEGTVFVVANNPGQAAKIYHKPPAADRQAKLRAMVGIATKELANVAAWPTSTLHERPGGPVCGLVMRRINNHKDVHFLYSPAHRKVAFPHADWRFLVHTAMNCAAAFDTVHSAGTVVSDVNQSNVLVSDQAMVALVDCDSFQVQWNGQSYLCEVGVDLFTPPELQGRSFRGVVRTPNHDRFGLAVLIFYLLFMNRHPFAGRYLGAGDMPINQAIAEHRFAFGRAARQFQMQSPAHAPTLNVLSPELGNLFEQAFGQGSGQPNGRPTARQWATALKTLVGSLRPCASDPGHVYAPHLSNCPWCLLIAQGAPNFFVSVAYTRAGGGVAGTFVLAAVWAKIEQVIRPNVSYVRPPMPIAASRPTPWPAGLGRTLSPMPLPPAILRSPQAPPAALLVPSRPIPVKPNPPAILTNPPRPPAIPTSLPSTDWKPVRRNSSQITIGYSAIGGAMAFAGLLVFAMLLGVAGNRSTAEVLGLLSVAPLVVSCAFGVWWTVLEVKRSKAQAELNREYEDELRRLRAEALRKQDAWNQRLAEQQAAARKLHKHEVARWEAQVSAIESEIRGRQAAWERELQRQQTELRRQYDQEVSAWRNVVDPIKAEAARRRNAADITRSRADAAEQQWKSTAAKFGVDFDKKREDLGRLRDRHNELARKYVSERQQLQSRAREIQLNLFLQQAFISDHKIPDIGRGRTATLSSYGIETAFDIVASTILDVPGFGQGLTARLVDWRRSIESQFVFNAAVGIPPQVQQELDSRYAQVRQQVEAGLLSGERDLRIIASTAQNQLAQHYSQISWSFAESAQAAADITAIPPGL